MNSTNRFEAQMRSARSNLLLALILAAAGSAVPASGGEAGEGMQDIPLRNWVVPVWYAPSAPAQHRGGKSTKPDDLGSGAEALPSAPLPFVAIAPCRMLDTRNPAGAYGGPALSGGGSRDFIAWNQCGIPATAQAISVNATVTQTLAAGFVSLFPSGTAFPGVSTVNFGPNDTVANAAIVPLGLDGGFTAAAASGTDLIVDVNGYFAGAIVTTSVNGLTGALTLAPGLDVSITPSGQTLTIAANSTSANMPNTLARRDLSGNFSAGTVTLDGNLALPGVTSTSAGVITLGGSRFAYALGTNSFFGYGAGNFTMTAFDNTATGKDALSSNMTGNYNTANGTGALQSNTTGIDNTASGSHALYSNSAGYSNAASGTNVMFFNTTGYFNTASGAEALFSNSTGNYNTASGFSALASNTTGNENIALGDEAGGNLTTGDYNIDIGNPGVAAEFATIRIGTTGTHTRAFIAGINGVTTGGAAVPVLVDANGQLGTASSSRRYKFDIEEMGERTVDLMHLRPVTFRYREQGTLAPIQFGLIAEEVAEVYPELVTRGKDGEVETVMYQFLAPMLLNEVQRQRRTIEEQQRTNESQQQTIEELQRTNERQERTLEEFREEFRARFERLERGIVGPGK